MAYFFTKVTTFIVIFTHLSFPSAQGTTLLPYKKI